MFELHEYRISGVRRDTGEVIEGLCQWDGLSSMYYVYAESERDRRPRDHQILSVLDRITRFERVWT